VCAHAQTRTNKHKTNPRRLTAPELFAYLELSVKTKAAAKMTLLPLYESDCAEAEGILRIDRKHHLLFLNTADDGTSG
jgi:hypothetical protein